MTEVGVYVADAKAYGVMRAEEERRAKAIEQAHEIARVTKQTAVVYRRQLPTLYSETDPPMKRWDYVPGSAYTAKPTRPIGLRLWMWISVTGLERLAGGDECP